MDASRKASMEYILVQQYSSSQSCSHADYTSIRVFGSRSEERPKWAGQHDGLFLVAIVVA